MSKCEHSKNSELKKKKDMRLDIQQTEKQKKMVIEFLDSKSYEEIVPIFFYSKEINPSTTFYSNFHTEKIPLKINGEYWINTEAYFQAMKFRGKKATPRMIEYSNIIKNADSPSKITGLGRQKKNMRFGKKWMINKKTDHRLLNDVIEEYKDIKPMKDWQNKSIYVMIEAVYYKFTQYESLKKKIMSIPDNAYLVEHTTRDSLWGDGGKENKVGPGKNYLGKILTALSYSIKYGNCSKMPAKLKKTLII